MTGMQQTCRALVVCACVFGFFLGAVDASTDLNLLSHAEQTLRLLPMNKMSKADCLSWCPCQVAATWARRKLRSSG